jgi:hypothetical protein
VSEPEDVHVHDISLAVWDVTSPVVAGRRATLKVGVACASGCDLTGTCIDIYNETATRVGGGTVAAAPWPGTTGLHWVEIEVTAPDTEGDHAWSVQATAVDAPHPQAASDVPFIAVRPPEHRVTLKAIEKGSAAPLAGVELRLGVFRAATDEAGIAEIEVPGGTYDVAAWKIGYDMLSSTAHVVADTTIHLEVSVTPKVAQPYWM